MWSWFAFWLVLHILFVLVAFGPTFAYPLIGALGAKQPQHMMFVLEYIEKVSERMTIPIGSWSPSPG